MSDSPNTLNYQYGAGSCFIKLDDDVDYRHVGNVPALNLTKEVTSVEHKQSMSGIKSTDFEYVTELSATLNMTLEEVTPENVALFMLGEVETNTAGQRFVRGLTKSSFEADFKYASDNPYGADIEYLARVSIKPTGEFNFITEELNSFQLELKVLKADGEFGRTVFVEEPTA